MQNLKSIIFILVGVTLVFSLVPGVFAAPDQMEQLYELAKKEGAVVWNTGGRVKTWKPLTDAFMKKFPSLDVKLVNVIAAKLAGQVITEYGAGKVSYDVSSQFASGYRPLFERNMVERYDFTGFPINKERLIYDGRAIHQNYGMEVVVCNSKLVPEAKRPRTWEDLLDPRWKGKLVVRENWWLLSFLEFAGWTKEEAREYVKKLLKQDLTIVARGSQLRRRILSGESLATITAAELTHALIEREDAPFGYTRVSPVATFEWATIALKGAPNPNAAKLLFMWLATDEAAEVLLKMGKAPYQGPLPISSTQGRLAHEYGWKAIQLDDTLEKMKQVEEGQREWRKMAGRELK